MSRPETAGAGMVLGAAALLAASIVLAEARERTDTFETGGSMRTVLAGTRNYDSAAVFGAGNDADAFTQTLLRLTVSGSPAAWVTVEAHAVQSVDFSTLASSGTAGLYSGAADVRYRTADDSWAWVNEGDVSARLWMDRFSATFTVPWADVTVGRQAITFGKAYFWNPLDVFLAFDPRQFDREYKAGVDGVRIDVPLGSFSGANAVGVAGRELDHTGAYGSGGAAFAGTWYGAAALVRGYTAVAGWDLAVQGGKVYGGYQGGFAASGEAGPIEVRAEGAYFAAIDRASTLPGAGVLADHELLVLGVGRRLTARTTVEAEYLLNGAGIPGNLDDAAMRVVGGGALHLGRHLAGAMAGIEVHPLMHVQLVWIGSFSDGSGIVQPGLTYSVSDESEFTAGAQLAYGDRPGTASSGAPTIESEFGSHPHLFYGQYKFYF